MENYNTIFTTDVKGKTILLRVDINSSIVDGRVIVSARLREHAKTMDELSMKGAKVVVLSHQGRPGDEDFVSLMRHANKVRKLNQREVGFVSWDDNYVDEIKRMKNGEILFLDNVRFQSQELEEKSAEEHSKGDFIKSLASVADYFVQDALSICHRSHATVVGFGPLLPCFVGPVLQRELTALEKLNNHGESRLFVLGGAKPKDSLILLRTMFSENKINKALVGGLFGELFLLAKGIKFGAKDSFFEDKGYMKLIPGVKRILDDYGGNIVLPVDLAYSDNGSRKYVEINGLPIDQVTKDIGKDTITLFNNFIDESKVCIFNGPMGVYEEPTFCIGTQKVLEKIAFSETFSIIGGGDSERAMTQLGLIPEDFSHVSLAGKALLRYLSGKKLPGLEILKAK